jgi:hypothetical protein
MTKPALVGVYDVETSRPVLDTKGLLLEREHLGQGDYSYNEAVGELLERCLYQGYTIVKFDEFTSPGAIQTLIMCYSH